jgi:hypothetical protein
LLFARTARSSEDRIVLGLKIRQPGSSIRHAEISYSSNPPGGVERPRAR